MQDRTINNALMALRKQGGHQGKLAEVLLDMRAVPLPNVYQFEPYKRGETVRLCLHALRDGPKTTHEIAAVLVAANPQIGKRDASHKVYMALWRLADKGQVVGEKDTWGRYAWSLAP